MIESIKNNIRQVFSSENLKQMLRRFPVAFACLTGVTIWLVINILIEYKLGETEGKVVYYLYTASLLDIALRLWMETSKTKFRYVWYCLAHLLWMGNTAWLIRMGTLATATIIGNGAALFAIAAAVLVGSYWKNDNDTAFFHFSTHIITLALRAILIGLLLMGGVSLLYLMLNTLFGIDISDKCYFITWLVCCWISACYILISLPQDHRPFENPNTPNRFGYGLGRFVFLPLVCTYTVVLYVYLLRILFTLTLPQGGVVWTVIILIAGLLATILLLYPKRTTGETPQVIETAITWLPRLALPLVLLMSVAIARRINDYGVTVARLYVVALNLWCYFAIIYLIATRAKRIKMLLTSFSIVFLLTSIGWQNLTNITSKVLQTQLTSAFVKAKPQMKLPMDQKSLQKWVDIAPAEEGKQVISKLFYLKGIDEQAFGQFVHSSVSRYEIELKDSTSSIRYSISFSLASDTQINIPKGYRHMHVVSFDLKLNHADILAGKVKVNDTYQGKKINATLDWNEIKRLDGLEVKEQNKQQPIACQVNDSTMILINDVWIVYAADDSSDRRDGYINGWMFTK